MEGKSTSELDEQSSANSGELNERTSEESKEVQNDNDAVETDGKMKEMDAEEKVEEKAASSAL